MTRSNTLRRVKRVFSKYIKLKPSDEQWLAKKTGGKLYELYCLSKVIDELVHSYGYAVRFVGRNIEFKMSPSMIKAGDSHFEVGGRAGSPLFEIYTDVEVTTLGTSIAAQAGLVANDRSTFHELDIAVVDAGTKGRPRHDQVALGVECKSHATFHKSIVKEALGLRRELSFVQGPGPSTLSVHSPIPHMVEVPADPASEYWLAFADPTGKQYESSPRSFGIRFCHWQP